MSCFKSIFIEGSKAGEEITFDEKMIDHAIINVSVPAPDGFAYESYIITPVYSGRGVKYLVIHNSLSLMDAMDILIKSYQKEQLEKKS